MRQCPMSSPMRLKARKSRWDLRSSVDVLLDSSGPVDLIYWEFGHGRRDMKHLFTLFLFLRSMV